MKIVSFEEYKRKMGIDDGQVDTKSIELIEQDDTDLYHALTENSMRSRNGHPAKHDIVGMFRNMIAKNLAM